MAKGTCGMLADSNLKRPGGDSQIWTDMAKDLQMGDRKFDEKYKEFSSQARLFYRIRALTKACDAALNVAENAIHRRSIERPIDAPIFLMGNFRSGTSFFEKILADHHDVGHFTYGSQVFPRSPIITSAFIRKFPLLNTAMVPVHMPASVNTESPYEGEGIWRFCRNNCWTESPVNILEKNYSDPRFERIFRSSIQKHLISQNRKRFINKNPWNTLRIGYLSKIFPDARFLYITRHPHRQLRSQLDLEAVLKKAMYGLEHFNEVFSDQFYPPRVFFRTHRSAAYIKLYPENKALATAMSIVDFDEEFDEQVKKLNIENRLMRVRYEDLVDQFTPILKRVFTFLGLEESEAKQVIAFNKASYLRRNLTSATAPLPEFTDEVRDCLSVLRDKHDYSS